MQRTYVSSSNISSIGYDTRTQMLEIEFHSGSIYQYYGVPSGLYQGLMSAASHGQYFDTYIKGGGYAYTQVR